jgi:hypothetical protein
MGAMTRHTIQARDLQVGDSIRIHGWSSFGRRNYWVLVESVVIDERHVTFVDDGGVEHRLERGAEIEVVID